VALTYTQNWDGVTPPAIPAGWNVDTDFATLAPNSNWVSSPNTLKLADAHTINVPAYATYATVDGNGGNVIVSAYFEFNGTNACQWGVAARGTGSTLDNSTTSQYVCWLQLNPGFPTLSTRVRISKVIAGTETPIASFVSTDQVAIGFFYQVVFIANGTSLEAQVIRYADGYSLQPSGLFAPQAASCLITTDGSLSSAGYTGIVAQQGATNSSLQTDNFAVTPPGVALPDEGIRNVHVVPVPFQFYPPWTQ
jgi:hypothetical protein